MTGREILAAFGVTGALYLVACGGMSPVATDRYELIGVKPGSVAVVFDRATGDVSLRPLPKMPDNGTHEVTE